MSRNTTKLKILVTEEHLSIIKTLPVKEFVFDKTNNLPVISYPTKNSTITTELAKINANLVDNAAGLDKGTNVIMFDGSIKAIEDMKIGDKVMGSDSKLRTVLSVHSGYANLYQITPTKGSDIICSENHVLSLKCPNPVINIDNSTKKKYRVMWYINGKSITRRFSTEQEADDFIQTLPFEEIFNISMKEYLGLIQNNKIRNYLYRPGIDFEEKEVPIDPYMIGFWLGDGSAGAPEITTIDQEIVLYFREQLTKYNLEVRNVDADITYKFSTPYKDQKPRCNHFRNVLKDYNMMHNKHIADIYKCNSRKVRLEILAGLIDSDGYVTCKGKNIEITQKNIKLSEDIEYLCFSLGFMITRSESIKGCPYKGEMKYGTYQRMKIFGDGLGDIPTMLNRKKLTSERLSNRRATCTSFSTEYISNEICYGIKLDGDGRYLLENFTISCGK